MASGPKKVTRFGEDPDKLVRELSIILEVLPDVLIFAEPNRCITKVNRCFTEHFGYSEAEARGRTTEFLYAHPEDFANTNIRYNPKAPDRSEPYVVEYRRKDGTTFMGQTVGVHVRDDDGRTMGYLGLTQDVTDALQLEEEMAAALARRQRSEELLKETERLAHVGGGEYYLGAEEVNWSDELYRLHDLPVGTRLSVEDTLSFFDDPAPVKEGVERALMTGESFEMETPITTAHGRRRWVRIKASAIVDESGAIQGVSGFHQDITEARQAAEAKRDFVSMVSHELRTPLTSIQGTLALVTGGVVGELPAEVRELLEIALRNARRLSILVDDILDIEKIEAGRIEITPQPVLLQVLIGELVESNRRFADEYGIVLRVHVPLEPAWIHADPVRLGQVITNLISNAVKYSPPQGMVDVTVALLGGQQARIAIRDRGPGIPAHFQDSLFEKFTRADSSDTRIQKGTGLGLSIAKALTEAMGGRIGFETSCEDGTTMYTDFALLDASTAPGCDAFWGH